MRIDDGVNIDATWTHQIVLAPDSVDNWDSIHKDGLGVGSVYLPNTKFHKYPDRAEIILKKGLDILCIFDIQDVSNQATWAGNAGGLEAGLQQAVSDIMAWIGTYP